MVNRVALIVCLLLGGCQRGVVPPDMLPSARAYINFKDQVAAQMLRWGIPWRFPCTKSVADKNGGYYESLPDDQCFKFSGPMRMQGLWRNDFEGSLFCSAPATQCTEPRSTSKIPRPHFVWLQMRHHLKELEDIAPGGLYAVDFIGRRSEYRGMYGHLGMADEEVIVDRLISIRELEAPPRQPTRAEVIEHFKKCAADKTCVPDWGAISAMETMS